MAEPPRSHQKQKRGASSNKNQQNDEFDRTSYRAPKNSPEDNKKCECACTQCPESNENKGKRQNDREDRSQPQQLYIPTNKVLDRDGMVVINLGENQGGSYVLEDLQRNPITIDLPKQRSKVTVSTKNADTASGNKGNLASTSCLHPEECDAMRWRSSSERSVGGVDNARLEQAIREAVASIHNLRTFDDVEELMELNAWTDIQRRLQMLIDDKKENLARKESQRQSEFLERQKNFYKRAINRISGEREAQKKAHEGLITMLEEQANSVAAADDDEQIQIDISRGHNTSGYDKFRPGMESTRLMEARERGGAAATEDERQTGACSCRSDRYTADYTDVHPTPRR